MTNHPQNPSVYHVTARCGRRYFCLKGSVCIRLMFEGTPMPHRDPSLVAEPNKPQLCAAARHTSGPAAGSPSE